MKILNRVMMTIASAMLIVAGILKAHQLLTTIIPTYSEIIAQYNGFELFMRVLECREFMILHIPFEIGLGVWLVCGLFRKACWLVSLFTFGFFIFVTYYKTINGFASCGCFGNVHIAPKITLYAIDIPIFLGLAIFYPRKEKLLPPPWPSSKHFWGVAIPTIIILISITAALFSVDAVQPEKLQASGQKWDKLEHIDISQTINTGMWVVLMYHNDCPNCIDAIPQYSEIATDYQGSISFAFIEIPPYDQGETIVPDETVAEIGKLDQSKNWLIQTPRVILLVDGVVEKSWEIDAPDIEEILTAIE